MGFHSVTVISPTAVTVENPPPNPSTDGDPTVVSEKTKEPTVEAQAPQEVPVVPVSQTGQPIIGVPVAEGIPTATAVTTEAANPHPSVEPPTPLMAPVTTDTKGKGREIDPGQLAGSSTAGESGIFPPHFRPGFMPTPFILSSQPMHSGVKIPCVDITQMCNLPPDYRRKKIVPMKPTVEMIQEEDNDMEIVNDAYDYHTWKKHPIHIQDRVDDRPAKVRPIFAEPCRNIQVTTLKQPETITEN
ncbi:uncharacterized protein EI90DRAFT_3136131 [Cantharellus anzutake]|uniref:uncharacterized protein n=1 Tax=Cantharellus anzutake TaxID=1750568 RepID=UPI00190691F5|nr:uncharacterized protein EI90DRAFT_3136131 [Cantharellus anzutake]KAF8314322.1 hypothetical protein EI90DRAFT_3136131 [Cantharellus anzutake]